MSVKKTSTAQMPRASGPGNKSQENGKEQRKAGIPGFTASTRTRLIILALVLLTLHLVTMGFFLLGQGSVLTLGLLLTAYLAGIKHSYDWDHLAAIDNSTRKFVSEGSRPVTVGFAFSLGHSSVVTLAGILLVAGAQAVGGAIDENSVSSYVLGLIGGGVSGFYLLAIGLYNAQSSTRIAQVLKRAEAGVPVQEADLKTQGAVARLIEAPLKRVRKPWHIYIVGFLFGLGFDTASTIALLILTVSASLSGASALALISLPLAFTAAMTLCDSLNGVAMMRLYATALTRPLKRLRFNLIITALSAASALLISCITLGGWFRDLLGLEDPVTAWLSEIDLGHAGLILIALFVVIWLFWWISTRQRNYRYPAA